MSVRSDQLAWIGITVPDSYQTLLTASSGHTIIVKSINAYIGGVGGAVYIGIDKGGTKRTFRKSIVTSDATLNIDPMWVVLEAGDVLFWYRTRAGGVGAISDDVTVSGAALLGNA